jgi:hypothetical protein
VVTLPRKPDEKKPENACISIKGDSNIDIINNKEVNGSQDSQRIEPSKKKPIFGEEVESEEEAFQSKQRMSILNKLKAEKMKDNVGLDLEEEGYTDFSWGWSAERNGVDVLAESDKEVLVGEVTNFSKKSYMPPKRLRRYRNNLLEEAEKQKKLHPNKKVRMFFVHTYNFEHPEILTEEGIELWQRDEIKLDKADYEEAGLYDNGQEPIVIWDDNK